MNYKLAITLLKTIDQLEGLEDLLEEHNGTHILVLRKLADVDESLAEQVETLELAAPYLFIEEYGKLEPKAKQHCKENGVVIRKGAEDDVPFMYYLDLENFSFGISEF